LIGLSHRKSKAITPDHRFLQEPTVSWDLFAQDLPAAITSVSDIPDDFVPQSIGKRVSLIAKIKGVVPQVDFAKPDWGKIHIPDCEIEIGMGNDEDVESIAFHVYGGELAPGVVVAILRALQLRALDSATGEIFNEVEAADSFMKWQKHRDKILLDTRPTPN
jgi:hypothetical protein